MDGLKFKAWDRVHERWLNIYSLVLSKDGRIMGVWELGKDGKNELYGLHQVDIICEDTKGHRIDEGVITEKEIMCYNLGHKVPEALCKFCMVDDCKMKKVIKKRKK